MQLSPEFPPDTCFMYPDIGCLSPNCVVRFPGVQESEIGGEAAFISGGDYLMEKEDLVRGSSADSESSLGIGDRVIPLSPTSQSVVDYAAKQFPYY